MNYLSEVLRNAVSLVDDADLLYQHHRYARAVALAALSMEEIGKFYIMKWKKDDQLTLIRKHVAIDMANSVLDEISAALAEIGFCLIHEDEMSDRQKQWVFSERGQKFHREFLESQETLNRVPEAIRQSIGAGVLKDLYAGQVDAIKQTIY